MGLDELKFSNKYDLNLYQAGFPGFPRNFTRDSIISGILMQNPGMLKDQLKFCAKIQGKEKNSLTGEEPGKIHHEHPGFKIRNSFTDYNACDTTALFLMGHEVYQKLTNDSALATVYKENIEEAKTYILRHLDKGAFLEDPLFSDAKNFALKVTYWKDSEVFGRENGCPVYPVVYTLAQAQNICGLRSAMFLLNENGLENKVSEMLKYLNAHLFDKNTREPFLLIDKQGAIPLISSDYLHMLFYLRPGDLSFENLRDIIKNSSKLETQWGYRVLSEEEGEKVGDVYHAKTLWPFEQAIINIGAKKFGLNHVEDVSSRINNFLDTDHEILMFREGGPKKGGCSVQLWTIAAKEYFNNFSKQGIFPGDSGFFTQKMN